MLRLFTILVFIASGQVREGGKKERKVMNLNTYTEGNDQIYPGIVILRGILFRN